MTEYALFLPLFQILVLHTTRDRILSVIDFFHKPFAGWIKKQTFRYLACGGSNTVLDILIYFISYNFILDKQPVPIFSITIAPHIAAFIISYRPVCIKIRSIVICRWNRYFCVNLTRLISLIIYSNPMPHPRSPSRLRLSL